MFRSCLGFPSLPGSLDNWSNPGWMNAKSEQLYKLYHLHSNVSGLWKKWKIKKGCWLLNKDKLWKALCSVPPLCCNLAGWLAGWWAIPPGHGAHTWSAGSWMGRGVSSATQTHPGCSRHKTDFQIQTEGSSTKIPEKRQPEAIGSIWSGLMDYEIYLSVNNFLFLHVHGFLSCCDGGLKDRPQGYQASVPRNKLTLQ